MTGVSLEDPSLKRFSLSTVRVTPKHGCNEVLFFQFASHTELTYLLAKLGFYLLPKLVV